jgi:hypothetical protein
MGIYKISEIRKFKSQYTELPDKIKLYLEKPKTKPWQKKTNWVLDKKNASDEDKFANHVRELLNKITDDNYYIIIPMIKAISVNDKKELELFINILLETVVRAEQYAHVYAKLCNDLSKAQISVKSDNEEFTFRKLLLLSCKNLFIKNITQQNIKKIDATAFSAFLGELYNNQLISTTVIMGCFDQLILSTCLNKIEMLLVLFHHTTKPLIVQDSKKHNELVSKIKTLSTSSSLNMREQILLEEILEETC